MALKTFVKISGITNLSDARYCSGMGVDQLGFSIEEGQSNYTDPEKFKEIKGWLSGVEFVGEFSSEFAGDFGDVAKAYELDAIQVERPEHVAYATAAGLPVILNMEADALASHGLNTMPTGIEYLLISAEEETNPDGVLSLADSAEIVLAFGITAENVDDLASSGLKGIALRGSDEIRPGYKDFDELADILEALEIDDTL